VILMSNRPKIDPSFSAFLFIFGGILSIHTAKIGYLG
jgi:hypothetical protein